MTQTASERTAAEVRAHLARQNRTASDLADALGMSAMSVSRRLRGVTPFNVDEIAAAAAFLGVSISDLVRMRDAS